MKPLLIGEAPGPNGDPEKPLDGAPARRLLNCMGYDLNPTAEKERAGKLLCEMFEVRNLIDRPMQRPEGEKGCGWAETEAQEAAKMLLVLVEKEQRVVLLGKRVARAFGMTDPKWYRWREPQAAIEGEFPMEALGSWAVIPHPSGIVRLWNEPLTRVQAGYTLWAALGKLPTFISLGPDS